MNGSPTHPAAKHERGTTASEICDFRGDEGAGILGRAIANFSLRTYHRLLCERCLEEIQSRRGVE